MAYVDGETVEVLDVTDGRVFKLTDQGSVASVSLSADGHRVAWIVGGFRGSGAVVQRNWNRSALA